MSIRLETTAGFPRKVTQVWRRLTEQALEERDKLGLYVPEGITVSVGLFQSDSAAAAMRKGKKNILLANTMPFTFEYKEASRRKRYLVGHTCIYLIRAREVFPHISEENILRAIYSEDPEHAYEDYFERKYKGERREWEINSRREYGVSMEEHINFLSRNAGRVRRYIEELKPEIIEGHERIFGAGRLVRHECDHLAFFGGKLKPKKDALNERVKNLQWEVQIQGNEDKAQKLAEANADLLDFTADYDTLMEACAHVFGFVPYDGWTDFEQQKERVRNKIHYILLFDYIDNPNVAQYPRSITDALVSQRWADGTMNRQTSNAIFRRVGGLAGAMSHDVSSPEEVDIDVAAETFYRDLPGYQMRFYQAAKRATDALMTAYSEDPTRLRRAYLEAETVDEFLGMCKC